MLTRDDVQNGNVLDTPDGERRVVGRVLTDNGTFVILATGDGVGSLYQEGALYDHDGFEVNSRPAASGVGAAQDQSQVDALTAKVDQQSALINALLERDKAREQQVNATQSQSSSTGPTDPTSEDANEVPGPATTSDALEDHSTTDPAIGTTPATGEAAGPADASTQGQIQTSEGATS